MQKKHKCDWQLVTENSCADLLKNISNNEEQYLDLYRLYCSEFLNYEHSVL